MKSILDISDDDLYHIAKEELNLIDREVISIVRNNDFVCFQWTSYCGAGLLRVLKNTIIMERGGRVYYVTQKSVDYLRGRGYDIPEWFFYDDRMKWFDCDEGL